MARINIYGRLAFPKLDKPEAFQGQGEPRFSAALIVEAGSDSHNKILAAALAAANEKWPGKGEAALKGLEKQNKLCYYDGDMKPDVDGYAGNIVLNANAKQNQPPALVVTRNGKNERLDRETQSVIYGGCYVNMIVEIWAQDNQWGKRINAQLAGVQFVKDGDAFAGGRAASEDDFEAVETSEADGNDDFF